MIAARPYTSLHDFRRRAGVCRPTVERLVLVGGFDAMYGRAERRELLGLIGASEGQLALEAAAEMTPAEIVEAELAVLGMDVSRHVLSFYRTFLDDLGVTRAEELQGLPDGAEVIVAGVKIASQTPAVRSGQRIIFVTLDDATGPVDLTFFESVQDRCAATVFGCWSRGAGCGGPAAGRPRSPPPTAGSSARCTRPGSPAPARSWNAAGPPAQDVRPRPGSSTTTGTRSPRTPTWARPAPRSNTER